MPDFGVYCHDAIHNEHLFLMDISMSRSLGRGAEVRGYVFATRTVPLGEYHMTTGAFLPVQYNEKFRNAFGRLAEKPGLFERPGGMALSIVRACLAAGAAEFAAYAPIEAKPKPRIEPRFSGFKRRRRPT